MTQAAIKAVPLGQAAAQRILAALAAEIPAAVDARAAPRQRRDAGVHADARHPLGAARGAILAPVPLVSAARSARLLSRRRSRHERPARHPAPHAHAAAAARRRRRAGRLGQDDAGRDALQGDARDLGPGRRHQRHLHQGRPAPADRRRRARRRPDHGRRDRRLPAHGDPRGRVDQPRGDRPHARASIPTPTSSSSRAAATTSPRPSAPSSRT